MDLIRRSMIALALAAAAGMAAPALAASQPSTRLVSCGADNCLLVSGRRNSAAAAVQINGHPVQVQGGRSWRVQLPVATVKDWSAPYARKITISFRDETRGQDRSEQAQLPIGLLGHVPDLASLVITVH